MSDISQGQEIGTADSQSQGQDGLEPDSSAQVPPVGGDQAGDPNSLASGFLQQVKEDHRPIVEPYVAQWDAGVTRRFQELHSQYAPFKAFLDAGYDQQAIVGALQLQTLLDNNPQYVLQRLQEELGIQQQLSEQGQEPTPQPGNSQFQGVPQELVEKLQKQDELLQAMGAILMQEHEQKTTQQEDEMLDKYMANLHKEFPTGFDDQYVLTLMGQGVDGPTAVKQFQTMLQQHAGQQEQQGNGPGSLAPTVIGGGGALPLGDTDIKKASDKDITSLTAGILAAANKTGQ